MGGRTDYINGTFQIKNDGYIVIQSWKKDINNYIKLYKIENNISKSVKELYDSVDCLTNTKTIFKLNGENENNYVGSYGYPSLGMFSRTLSNINSFNYVKVRYAFASTNCVAEYKIYKKYTGESSSSRSGNRINFYNNGTLISEGQIKLSTKPETFFIKVPKTVINIGEQVFFLMCGRPTSDTVYFSGWSSNSSLDDGVSNTVLLSDPNEYSAEIDEIFKVDYLFGVVGSYGAPALELYQKSDFLTIDETSELIDNKLKYVSQSIESNSVDIVINKTIVAVVGDKLQIYYRSIFNVPNLEDYEVFSICSKGQHFPRYFEFTPQDSDVGEYSLTFYIGKCVDCSIPAPTIIKSKSITLKVIPAPTSGTKTLLLVGDSTIGSGAWPREVKRRFASSSGTPIGLGLTNIKLGGISTGTIDGLSYGWHSAQSGGWSWDTYTGSSSPFVSDGNMNFVSYANSYCDGNIDILITGLGINNVYGKQSYSELNSTIEHILERVRYFIRGFHNDFPNAKVMLMTICRCSPDGGMGANYGAGWGATVIPYDMCVFALNKAYMEFVEETEFKDFVSIIDASAEFDSEHSYPEDVVPVNTRSNITENRGANGVHPTETGHMMWADSIFREVCNILQ